MSILTIMVSIGQVTGPLLAAPLLTIGYSAALLLGAVIVACSALTAVLTTLPYPQKRRTRSYLVHLGAGTSYHSAAPSNVIHSLSKGT